MLTITLDWVSFTLKDKSYDAETWVNLYASPETGVPCKPVQNYTDAYQASNGVLVCWNTRRTEMGTHIVIGGTALRNIWEHHEVSQRELLGQISDIGGRVSRLDLAKDLPDVEIDYDEIYKKAEVGDYSGTARTPSQRKSPNGGNTIYIGSTKSDKFFRIYNKAAEQNLQGQLWARFELESKGMVARSLHALLVSTDNWQGAFDKIVRDMFTPNKCPSFDAFFEQGIVPIGLPSLEKTSDREKWISSQVVPAVVKHFTEHRDSKAVALLRDMLDFVAQGDTIKGLDG
jgi:hypothetical protein